MARQTKPLTSAECNNAKPTEKDYSKFDGGGLYLLIKKNGSKIWHCKYTKPNGKAGLLSFGAYPVMGLADARSMREEVKALLARGIDPQEHKQQQNIAAVLGAVNSFESVALEWHAKEMASSNWSVDHAGRIMQRITTDLFPSIGKRPIESLKTRDLLIPLQLAVARDVLDLAKRLRQYMTAIMRYAVQTGRIDSNPALDLQGAVATRKTKHYPALPLPRLSELVQRIAHYSGSHVAKYATRFALLTGARSSEFRFSRWAEFDLVAGIWTIPEEREAVAGVKFSDRGEKMSRERVIYLSRQTVALLESLQAINGRSAFVFQGQKHNTPISENTVNLTLRKLGYDTQQDVCLHGFRTMMVSSLNESTQFTSDAIERHIGHESGNEVRGIYNRNAQYLAERQRMLQWWADYIDQLSAGYYIPPADFSNEYSGKIIKLKAA
jgi:integrase